MTDTAIKTLTQEKIKIEEPSKYDVLFLNDEVTTFEFVVKVLMQIFGKTTEQAMAINQTDTRAGQGHRGHLPTRDRRAEGHRDHCVGPRRGLSPTGQGTEA
jgi:hypothetical protein